MKTARFGTAVLAGGVAAVGIAVAGGGCKQIIGWEPASTWDGGLGSTTGSGDSGMVTHCASLSDCPNGGGCSTPTCTDGLCGATALPNGTSCNQGLGSCLGGACVCTSQDTCPSGCVDLKTDAMNCGKCGNACPATASCTGGQCMCPGTHVACGTSCVDTTTDDANCGTCGNVCPTNGPCTGGKCVCSGGLVACGTSCVDTTMDGANCGACGHSCRGATCSGSLCTPVVLASGQPVYIVLDATTAYFTDLGDGGIYNGSVYKVPLAGGTTTPLVSGQAGPLAVDGTNVYFATQTTIMKVPIAGGTPTPLASAQTKSIAVDATSVYWADFSTGAIMKVPTSGGSTTTLTPGSNPVVSLAVDTTSVYWGEADGTVNKVALDGGTPAMLASGLSAPGYVAVDTTSVYVVTSSGISKVPIGGGTPTTIVSDGVGPLGIGVDTTGVYYMDRVTTNVMRAPIGGGTPTLVASTQVGPGAVAANATNVCWSAANGLLTVPE